MMFDPELIAAATFCNRCVERVFGFHAFVLFCFCFYSSLFYWYVEVCLVLTVGAAIKKTLTLLFVHLILTQISALL